jgi:hypothetical protein
MPLLRWVLFLPLEFLPIPFRSGVITRRQDGETKPEEGGAWVEDIQGNSVPSMNKGDKRRDRDCRRSRYLLSI